MIDENLIKEYTLSTLQVRKSMAKRQNTRFSMHQFIALNTIARYQDGDKGECNVTELTASTDMAMPNVVRMLNEMQMKGYITRRRTGRTVYVGITDEGKEYLNWCIDIADDQTRAIVEELHKSDITDDEINTFLATAIKLNKISLEYQNKLELRR